MENNVANNGNIFCSKCGTLLLPTQRFCPNCGQKYVDPNVCGRCGAALQAGSSFCSSCGKKQKYINPSQQSVRVSLPRESQKKVPLMKSIGNWFRKAAHFVRRKQARFIEIYEMKNISAIVSAVLFVIQVASCVIMPKSGHSELKALGYSFVQALFSFKKISGQTRFVIVIMLLFLAVILLDFVFSVYRAKKGNTKKRAWETVKKRSMRQLIW